MSDLDPILRESCRKIWRIPEVEALLPLTVSEKLIRWDTDYRLCDFSHIQLRKKDVVSEAVFSTQWAEDVFRYWKHLDGDSQRLWAVRFEDRVFENWENLNGNQYRTWRVKEDWETFKLSCGAEYSIPSYRGKDSPKPCQHSGGCSLKYTWPIHPTGH